MLRETSQPTLIGREFTAPAVLSPQIIEMRKLRRKGWTIASLAKRYDKTPAEVGRDLGPDL